VQQHSSVIAITDKVLFLLSAPLPTSFLISFPALVRCSSNPLIRYFSIINYYFVVQSTSSDPKQGASSSAGSSSASPEYTPKLAQQFVTVLWKKVTGSVTDPKPTEPRTCFLPYLPEDNEDERIDAIESISDDVGILLKAKKAYFWSVVLHDANFSVMLDSFFRHCTREWDQQAAPVDASDNDSVEPRHLLMRRMFHLILRCTVSPAASHAWHVKNFLYDQRVLDFPRLLDFVAIYSTYSSSLASAAESAAILRALRRVITGLVRADPRYLEDWKRTIQSVVTLLSDAIPAQVAKLLKEVVVSAAVDPLRSSSDSAIDAAPRTLHDVVRYVNDILLSIASFAFIYPDACNLHNLTPSLAVSFIRAISAAHDVLLPGLSFLIDRAAVTDTDGVAELMVLGNQARRSALALAPLLLERCCLLEEIPTKAPQDREMHGELVYGILEAMLNSTSANTESHLPLPSEHLKSLAADLLHTISKDHPNHIVHGALLTNIDQRRAILIRLKQFAERLDADGLDVTRVEYVLASVKTIVGQLPERKRTVFSSSNTTTATKPSASASVSASEAWLSALKHTATVKEVFSDLGDGFVTLCLVHYKADPQQATSALLEETLPSNIKALSRTLTLEEGAAIHRGESSAAVAATLSQRKNVFDGDNFDLLSKGSASANDQANIILGKKNGDDWKSVMNDKSSLNSKVRESILYEDEPDDSYVARLFFSFFFFFLLKRNKNMLPTSVPSNY
jgi:hypothetical protein